MITENCVLKKESLQFLGLKSAVYTLYNDILRIAGNLVETRENIKIESHPFYHMDINFCVFPGKFLAMRNISLYSVIGLFKVNLEFSFSFSGLHSNVGFKPEIHFIFKFQF